MRYRTMGIVFALVIIIAAAYTAWSPRPEQAAWDLSLLEANWGLPQDSWIMAALDPHGPRYQAVDLPHPGWLLSPEERAGGLFAQVIVEGVVDLQEGIILPSTLFDEH